MNCDEMRFVLSSICDGQPLSAEVAGHLGTCAECDALLKKYQAMGLAIRNRANSYQWRNLQPHFKVTRSSGWWTTWKGAVQVPRIVFASMLVAIAILSGSLLLVRAKTAAAMPEGAMVLTQEFPDGHTTKCAMPVDAKAPTEACLVATSVKGGYIASSTRVLSKEGERVELGFKAKHSTNRFSNAVEFLAGEPEQSVWVTPGKRTSVSIEGYGTISLRSELLDWMPLIPARFNEPLRPSVNEFRLVYPTLVQGNQVLYNGTGSTSIVTDVADAAASIYVPDQGRFIVSTIPFEGGVESKVRVSEIAFRLDGHDYVLYNAMPPTLAPRVWVRRDPDYQSSEPTKASIVSTSLAELLSGKSNH
jgi:hypothetical protein